MAQTTLCFRTRARWWKSYAAADLLAEARHLYAARELSSAQWLREGGGLLLLTWQGDAVNDTIALLLTADGLHATNEGIAVRVATQDDAGLQRVLSTLAEQPAYTVEQLKLKPQNVIREKWDAYLPDGLRVASFASSALDLAGAHATLRRLHTAVSRSTQP